MYEIITNIMPRGGVREGAGRKKKANAYKGEPTTAVRIPASVAESLLALLEDGKRVAILEAGKQPEPSPELEKLREQNLELAGKLEAVYAELHQANGRADDFQARLLECQIALKETSQSSLEVERLKTENDQLTQQRDELDRELNTLHEKNGDLHLELSHLQENIGDLQHQIKNLQKANDVKPEQPGLEPEVIQSAIAALLEAINTPANLSNKGKVAQALRLLGAEVPEGKARGKRQKS